MARFPWRRLAGSVLIVASLGTLGGGVLYVHELRTQIACYADFSRQFAAAVDQKTAAESELWDRFLVLISRSAARPPTPEERRAGIDAARDALQTYQGDLGKMRAVGQQALPCGQLP